MIDYSRITSKEDLVNLFREVGLTHGMAVMVHSSMKSLGYVINGALDVIDAILECIGGGEGTLLMPAHSGHLTDPATWTQPAVPKQYIEKIKVFMRPFDPKLTHVRNRGIIAQTFLSYPGVMRSHHPLNSVAAKGKDAIYFTQEHELHESEGLRSPIGRLYQKGGNVLLIGVGLNRCTAIHLAEFIADVPYLYDAQVRVLINEKMGQNQFVRLKRYPEKSEHFNKLMPDLQSLKMIREVNFGSGRIFFFSIKPVVDYTVQKLRENPEYLVTV